MDILFNKWWRHGLLKPLECGLLKNCAPESGFINDLKEMAIILKAIFYDKPIAGLSLNIQGLEKFVADKK
jgi:hypothetical protein